MPASSYGNLSATPSASNRGGDVNKQAFVNQAILWIGLSEAPGEQNGLNGSYRQIIELVYPGYHDAWCAVFVSACAQQAGIQSIIPKNTWAYGIGAGILANGGKSIPGMGSSMRCEVSPAVGDTIQFGSGAVDSDGNPTQNDSAHVYHVGIVVGVDASNRKFTSVEGNSGDKVSRHTYNFGESSIYYLARPNWSRVGGFSEPVILQPHADGTFTECTDLYPGVGNASSMLSSSGFTGITVYNDVRNGTPNDRHDMTMREICYFSDQGTFVPNKSDITISAINYTTLLGNLYDQFAQYYPDGYTINTENLDGNIAICIDFFAGKGLNPAAAAGITACLFVQSGIGTKYKGGGICAWEGKYQRDMHAQVDDWATNLSGQLEFLWTDLTTNYGTMLAVMDNVPVTDNGARLAANRFMVSYRYTEAVQSVDDELSKSTRAQDIAAGWFNKIVITPSTPSGSSYSSPTAVTIPIATGELGPVNSLGSATGMYYPDINEQAIPLADANTGVTWSFTQCPYQQTGINTAFTSYSSWFNDWHPRSPQKKLANIWSNDWGRSCDRGIATINGCYLVAVAQTFGTIGTVLQINLDNGQSFKALMADAKSTGDSNYTAWGHLDNNGRVNVIEWEVVKVINGVAATSGDRYAGYPPDLTGWAGANVTSITNLGKMYNLTWT